MTRDGRFASLDMQPASPESSVVPPLSLQAALHRVSTGRNDDSVHSTRHVACFAKVQRESHRPESATTMQASFIVRSLYGAYGTSV